MDWIEYMGLFGSAISSITFMPQVYQVYKTKSVGDVNLMMLLIVFISTIIWLIYGVGKGLLPVIVCNSIICMLSLILIYFKISYSKK